MIALAAASGATLAVGHTERFNPAVQAALAVLRQPRFIEVHRLSGFPERSLDIDVIFDVMIHDLDIILAVDRSEVIVVEAVGVPVLTSRIDIANARIRSRRAASPTSPPAASAATRSGRSAASSRTCTCRSTTASQELEVWRLRQRRRRPAGHRRRAGGGDARRAAPARAGDFVDAIRSRAGAPRVSDGRWPARDGAGAGDARGRGHRRRIEDSCSPTSPPSSPSSTAGGSSPGSPIPSVRTSRSRPSSIAHASRRAAVRRCCSSIRPAARCRSRPTSSDRCRGSASRSA